MWLQPYATEHYSTEDFKTDIDELWNNMKGLYIKLHAYVRHRLRTEGPYADSFGSDSPIPAHILGERTLGRTPFLLTFHRDGNCCSQHVVLRIKYTLGKFIAQVEQ